MICPSWCKTTFHTYNIMFRTLRHMSTYASSSVAMFAPASTTLASNGNFYMNSRLFGALSSKSHKPDALLVSRLTSHNIRQQHNPCFYSVFSRCIQITPCHTLTQIRPKHPWDTNDPKLLHRQSSKYCTFSALFATTGSHSPRRDTHELYFNGFLWFQEHKSSLSGLYLCTFSSVNIYPSWLHFFSNTHSRHRTRWSHYLPPPHSYSLRHHPVFYGYRNLAIPRDWLRRFCRITPAFLHLAVCSLQFSANSTATISDLLHYQDFNQSLLKVRITTTHSFRHTVQCVVRYLVHSPASCWPVSNVFHHFTSWKTSVFTKRSSNVTNLYFYRRLDSGKKRPHMIERT